MPFYRSNLGIFFNKTYLQDPPIQSLVFEKIKFEDVNAWEILHEEIEDKEIILGIYASHDPYGDFYIIKNKQQVIEFFGDTAKDEIEQYLQDNKIDYRINDKVVIGSKEIFKEAK